LICRSIGIIRRGLHLFDCVEFEPAEELSKVVILEMRRYQTCDGRVKAIEAGKLGHFKSERRAVNRALAEFVQRRRRRILDLAGKIEFDLDWDYKKIRRGRS
jgi:aminoglycoside phosphotransferase family enzyme